ncbi:hypothetical protein KPH14_001651 [Odynerus spinipes]|uniref:Uncharacterized protein n=1 Tax=Odynerus spinipes TaxID=1348599 RepID=A0AAD9S153_9HYME|nr:hypothetical protein KPH14_001651 [Odynerus spinipes]
MTSEEDCPCTDVSEPSNATSLRTDVSSVIHSSESYLGIVDEGKKSHEEMHKKNFYANREVSPKIERSSRQASPAVTDRTIMQFEPPIACLCHAQRIRSCKLPVKYTKDRPQFHRSFWSRLGCKWPSKAYSNERDKTYEVKLKQNTRYDKPFVCCEISEGIPNKMKNSAVKTKPPKYQEAKPKGKRENLAERIDIYYFDHGNSAYYRTTDSPPILVTDKCAEKTDQAATRFWAEIFGTIHIGTAFVTAFILQLIRFILFSLVRPLTVGILQLFADYFMKPLLSIIFNALIQPVLILFYNIATSIKDLCEPLAEAIGLFLREIANLCRAIRIIEIKRENANPTSCT